MGLIQILQSMTLAARVAAHNSNNAYLDNRTTTDIEEGSNLYYTPERIKALVSLGTTTGTTSAFVCTPSLAVPAYSAGMMHIINFHTSIAAEATLNISGLGAKTLRFADGSALWETVAAGLHTVMYDGTYFRLVDVTIETGGTSTNRYERHADGRLTVYQQHTLSNVPITTAWGSLYITSSIIPADFVKPFVAIPHVAHEYWGGGTTVAAMIMPQPGGGALSTTNSGSVWGVRGTLNTDNLTGTLYIAANGRWK